MSSPPSGIITFLFTDIEGSTKLSQEYPDTLPAALDMHHSIVEKAVKSYNGYVFEIVGDAFCTAFENSEDAIKAAVEMQLNLAKEKWEDAVIKIRIGIHSGDAEWNGKTYSGYITMARTARVMSSAYGEQIIISKITYELAKEKFDSVKEKGITFRDLGERRLKDLIQPIQIYQVLSKGLRTEFPPLLTLDARPNNLPIQLTSFIGRESEMRIIKSLLNESHLLTLMGSGGAGKSRIALQAGADTIDNFSHGVWIVELAQLSEPSYILPEIASALGISLDPKKNIKDVVLDFLREKEMLLILDNCEHMIDECAVIINTLLRYCKKLRIIASSREALRITGENTYRVPSFKLPDLKKAKTVEDISEYEAVRLFIDRAVAIKNDFRITDSNANKVARLVSQLDGIPLAIELAAARVKVLTVEEIYEKLSNRFALLTGGNRTALPRQKTLRAMIDWSYDLLSKEEKLLFERLTVFSDGWTLEAAEEICSDEKLESYEILDLLSNLVDKSIVIVKESGEENRFNMLKTLRQYGSEKLNISEDKYIIQKKHFDVYSRFMNNAEQNLGGADQKEWVSKYDSEIDNIRESLKWAAGNDPEAALRLALNAANYWDTKYYYTEAVEFLDSILNKEHSYDKKFYAGALRWKGFFLKQTGRIEEAKELLRKSNITAKESGDLKESSASESLLGVIAFEEGDYEIAKEHLNNSLSVSISLGDKSRTAFAHYCLGGIAYMQTDYDSSKKMIEESLRLYRESKDLKQIGICLGNLGTVEFQLGNLQSALKLYEEYLSISRELDSKKGITYALLNISYIYNQEKEYIKAREYQQESYEIGEEIGNKNIIALSLLSLGSSEQKAGNYPVAKDMFIKSFIMFDELKDKYQVVESILLLSEVYFSMNDLTRSAFLLSAFDALYKILGIQMNKINADDFGNNLIKLKSELPEKDFETAWEKGQSATFENIKKLIMN